MLHMRNNQTYSTNHRKHSHIEKEKEKPAYNRNPHSTHVMGDLQMVLLCLQSLLLYCMVIAVLTALADLEIEAALRC